MIQSRLVVPKKHLFLVINRREQFFQSIKFHESSCGQSFLNGYAILRRALATVNCMYKMYLTDISIKGGFLFRSSTHSFTFEWYHHYFRESLAVI